MIDTGGIELEDTPFQKQIRAQAELAIDEADVIIFLTNGRDGVTSDDEEVARLLYKTDKPVVLAVNKIDNFDMNHMIYDFYSLGFGDPFPISGSHGLGIGDLLDEVCKNFKVLEEEEEESSGLESESLIDSSASAEVHFIAGKIKELMANQFEIMHEESTKENPKKRPI